MTDDNDNFDEKIGIHNISKLIKQETYITYTLNEIENMTDSYFPIRDSNDNPTFRPHQRETIIKIAKSFFIDHIKFVAIDGPVGCGKSAINYTIARMVSKAIYLTPLKMLQDQVAQEKWPHVRMLKGISSYLCNVAGYDTTSYKCNYDGDDITTCNNSKIEANYGDGTLNNLVHEIESVNESFSNNNYILNARTAFSEIKEIENNIEGIRKFLIQNICDRRDNEMDYYEAEKYVLKSRLLEKSICCSIDSKYECPIKTNRLLTKMAKIKVLNPDIFYLLSKNVMSHYFENDLLIFDECQQIEGVVNRIFKKDVPINIIKNLYDIDIENVVDINNPKDSISRIFSLIKDKIGPLMIASKILKKIGDVSMVKNLFTFERIGSKTEYAESFKDCANNYFFYIKGYNEVSIINIINHAFTGKELSEDIISLKPFIDLVRLDFLESCKEINCSDKIDLYDFFIPKCKSLFKDKIEEIKHDLTKPLTKHEISQNIENSQISSTDDHVYINHAIDFNSIVCDFVYSFCSLFSEVEKPEKPEFMLSINKGYFDNKLSDKFSDYFKYNKNNESLITIIPIAIGNIMNRSFYSKADMVLLTSGTWVCPDSLFKLYGINKQNSVFIKIPSTFKPENRKIFVINDNRFLDFSAKNEAKEYLYKLEDGSKRFPRHLSSIIARVRNYIIKNHNENPNIIVHCFTYDIAERIAKHMPGMDDSFLIHLQSKFGLIKNEINGYKSFNRNKDELIDIIKNNPNKGLTIISPSISEGVDFKGKLSRAQIILKNPIPNIGDGYNNCHYKGSDTFGIIKDRNFISRICFTTMTQQYGRVVRSEDDWGYTIIMDQHITGAISDLLRSKGKIKELNIEYFMEGVQASLNKNRIPIYDWIFD